jgi:hypothetical protein
MKLARLIIAAFLALVPVVAMSTAQEPDVLLLDDERVAIFTNPLEPYLERHPDLRFEPTSSANWRGYVATFAIRNRTLWLHRVEVSRYVEIGDRLERRVEDMTTRLFRSEAPLIADWYTGVLVIPRGERVHYVHMGYGSTYERYSLLPIRRGALVARREMTAEQFDRHRRAMFEAYKTTPEYRKRLEESRKAGLDAKSAEGFLFQHESANYLTRAANP